MERKVLDTYQVQTHWFRDAPQNKRKRASNIVTFNLELLRLISTLMRMIKFVPD
jgi:hypothetical protein